MSLSWLRAAALLGLLLVLSPLATASVRLTGNERKLSLAEAAEVYEDKSAAMDVAEVARQPFAPVSARWLNPGYTTSALWFKFSFTNTSAAPLLRWLSVRSTRLQEVSLFLPEDGQWGRMDAGTRVPFAAHPLHTNGAVFPLRIAPGASLTAYVRIASATTITIEPTLWEPLAFTEAEGGERLEAGLLVGALILACIFSLLMFIVLKDRAFLTYAMANFLYVAFEFGIRGYSFMYLWPGATDWATRSIGVSGLLAAALLMPFVQDLLRTRERLPRWNRALTLSWLLVPPLLAGLLFGDYHFWTSLGSLAVVLFMLLLSITGGLAIWKRFPASRFYAVAFVVALVDNVLRMSEVFGFALAGLRGMDYHSLVILGVHTLMLSAVVDRIMLARAEKEAALKALNETLEAHEARLEKAVADRTSDLDAALTQVRSAHQAQSQLLGYIGHDLRTPLAMIVNYVQQLNRGHGAEARKYQETIERSATHQLELIDELLEYSRGELNRLELSPVPTYLHAWLQEIIGQAELLAKQHDNSFVVGTGELPAVAVFDPKRMRQVLLNLLGNAAKYTSSGAIRLYVDATAVSPDGAVLSWVVEDTGPGIPLNDRERIFMPFERRTSERPGSGLGLSIARQIVRGMGGELRLESVPGIGSRFSFEVTLPLAEEADVQPPMEAFAQPAPYGAGKKVLLVWSAASGEALRDALSMADFDAVEARDGAEASRMAAKQAFDAVIVDASVPGIDPWALLESIPNQGKTGTPTVLCCAKPIPRHSGSPAALDFAAVLFKPVTANKLLATLERLVAGAELASAASPAMTDNGAADADFGRLRALVGLGNVSDIEAWASDFARRCPEQTAFARQVEEAARNIDMDRLEQLADNGQEATPR